MEVCLCSSLNIVCSLVISVSFSEHVVHKLHYKAIIFCRFCFITLLFDRKLLWVFLLDITCDYPSFLELF